MRQQDGVAKDFAQTDRQGRARDAGQNGNAEGVPPLRPGDQNQSTADSAPRAIDFHERFADQPEFFGLVRRRFQVLKVGD